MVNDSAVAITSDTDIVTARQRGRAMAAKIGFTSTDQIVIATAISELARNIVEYAKRGEVLLREMYGSRRGLEIVARDSGPGIADVGQAMRDGYSTSRSLGLGLPGTRRLMDDFELTSEPGKGTTVTVRKWLR